MDTEELEALDPLHYSSIDVDVVHNQLLCLVDVEGEDVVSDFLPIGCLIVVCDSSYHRCCVGVVHCHAVVGEQGVQEETKHAPLRGPRC